MQLEAVSIVMPALNEEKNIQMSIRNCLAAMDDFKIRGEVVVVNDGSTDKTKELVEEIQAQDPRVRCINNPKPTGFGAAFWKGVDSAQEEILVMIPGDNENDPWEILRYFFLMSHVDMVIPFVYNKEVRSLFRRVLSFTYRLIVNSTFGTNLNYTNGTVIYRRNLLAELPYRSYGFFFQTDILIRLLRAGYLFAEVPYRLDVRTDGVSKALTFPSFVNVVKGYLRLARDLRKIPAGKLANETASQNRKEHPNERYTRSP